MTSQPQKLKIAAEIHAVAKARGSEVRLEDVIEVVELYELMSPRRSDSPQRGLTSAEAAKVVGVSRAFLIRLADAGEIPCERVGRDRRFSESDLADYLTNREVRKELEAAEGRAGRRLVGRPARLQLAHSSHRGEETDLRLDVHDAQRLGLYPLVTLTRKDGQTRLEATLVDPLDSCPPLTLARIRNGTPDTSSFDPGLGGTLFVVLDGEATEYAIYRSEQR